MLRLAGLLGIVLSLGLAGIFKAQQLKARVSLLEDFMQMVLELKGQISYFREPLPLIFSKVDKRTGSRACMLLGAVESRLGRQDGQDAGITEIWSFNVEEIYKNTPLTPDDLETLKYLGSFVGQTDYDNHIFHFSYLEEKLGRQIDEAKANLKLKGPMYRKIGFFLGATLAILLI